MNGVTFTVFRDTRGEWRWHAKARNGKIIADSAEGYRTKRGALHGLSVLIGGAAHLAHHSIDIRPTHTADELPHRGS